MNFLQDLRKYGPESTHVCSEDEARRYCHALANTHYENFSVVSMLTPRSMRRSFESVYAYCRWSDDLGDEVGDRARSSELLGWWKGELLAIYESSNARHPVMIELSKTIAKHSIPIEPFLDLISAFEQDQHVLDYGTYDQLLDYCRRSANPVGRLVLYVADAFDEERASFADLTCTGLQLANFWQDVARDADIGRIYLPKEYRDRHGVKAEHIRKKQFSPEFAKMLESLVDRTRDMLCYGRNLLPILPIEIARAVDLFNLGGLAILDRIVKQNFDVLAQRPRLGKLAKAGLILRAITTRSYVDRVETANTRRLRSIQAKSVVRKAK